MMNAELLKEIKAYLKPARKRLVCSKKSKDDFYRDILASAEEYLQLHPNASKKELCEYLGDWEALASGFMDSPVSYTHLDVYKRQGLYLPVKTE